MRLSLRCCEESVDGFDWRKLGEPRNWVKLGVRIGAVRVVLNLGLEPIRDCSSWANEGFQCG